MLINEDLTKVVLLDAGQMDWIASPAAGVDRRMLYRGGDEIARATSIVRYAPGSAFLAHGHTSVNSGIPCQSFFQFPAVRPQYLSNLRPVTPCKYSKWRRERSRPY